MSIIKILGAVFGLLLVQVPLAWVNYFYAIALHRGVEPWILIVYRSIGSLVLLPLACRFGERQHWTKILGNWKLFLGYCFLFGLLGIALPQNLNAASISYLTPASATFASGIGNRSIIVMSFLIRLFSSWLFNRKEPFTLESWYGKVTLIGLVSATFAVLVPALWEGPTFISLRSNYDLAPIPSQTDDDNKLFTGVLMSLAGSASTAASLVVQVKIYEIFPYYFTTTASMNITGGILTTMYAVLRSALDHSWGNWMLMDWDIKLILVLLYLGFICSGMMMALMAWCTKQVGPEYASSFNYLALIIAAIGSPLASEGELYLGSFVGAILVSVGSCAFLCAKALEPADQCSNPKDDLRDIENGEDDPDHQEGKSSPCNDPVEIENGEDDIGDCQEEKFSPCDDLLATKNGEDVPDHQEEESIAPSDDDPVIEIMIGEDIHVDHQEEKRGPSDDCLAIKVIDEDVSGYQEESSPSDDCLAIEINEDVSDHQEEISPSDDCLAIEIDDEDLSDHQEEEEEDLNGTYEQGDDEDHHVVNPDHGHHGARQL